ncbi:MAG: hypothetical protein HON90_10470 [Halobacteriovoraceae bacterium]|jgi:hypothetical protein|nr:hypothetical protein [Halobacteriovoraceae bacterium]
MIELEIIESTDVNRLGKYFFHSNSISFGSHINDKLYSCDKNIIGAHLNFHIEGKKLQLLMSDEIESIHINGKKTTASKQIYNNDIIRVGKTEILILKFSAEVEATRKKFFNERVIQLQHEDPARIKIIQQIKP